MATTVRTIANDTATVLEMAVSSAALTATLDSDTLILRQEQLAQKREVEKRRAAHAKQLKYPKKLSKNNSLHKRLDPKESSHLNTTPEAVLHVMAEMRCGAEEAASFHQEYLSARSDGERSSCVQRRAALLVQSSSPCVRR